MSSPHQRDVDTAHLHPAVREAARLIVEELNTEGFPFRIFEAFRSPQRQEFLYAQGRTRPGPIVTKARPWRSYHQYGLAIDLVLFVNGQWSWKTSGEYRDAWKRMHQIGESHGLEALSWELPHLQMAGLDSGDLANGKYPSGGDESWAENLEAAIAGWSGTPAAPPVPEEIPTRPPLPMEALVATETFTQSNPLPAVGQQSWHRKFNGIEWRFDEDGIYIRSYAGGQKPLRSSGAPLTCRAIWDAFSVQIDLMARRFAIPPEIIIMTIAAEAAAYRAQGFTGPSTFRWEAHVWNKDVNPPVQGDYSAGPMQTLATTARWVIDAQSLPYHKFQVAPVYPLRPSPPPAIHPLYDATTNIEIGTAEIKQRFGLTGSDPILVAAAFNAGGLYETDANAWHLRSHGNHLDRAAQWFGDACAVLKEVGLR